MSHAQAALPRPRTSRFGGHTGVDAIGRTNDNKTRHSALENGTRTMSKRTRPHLGGLWQWSMAGKLARLTCLSAVLTTTPAVRAEEPAKPVRFDPVAQQIEGWTVLVEPALLSGGQHAEEGERALKMLANHLQRISILVPEDRLEKLKQVEFWV